MDLAGLQRLLGEPEIAWLVERIRGRLERGEPVDGTVTLVGATHAERRAATRLLGHGVGRGTSLSVPLPEVAAALRRAGAAPSLQAAVEALTGPVRDLAAERAGEIQRWEDMLIPARTSPLASLAWYRAWLEEITRDGTVTRLIRQGHGPVLAQAPAVLERIPGGPEPSGVMLADLATAAAGDPAALSQGQLPTLVLRALALREEVPVPADRGGGAGAVDRGRGGRRRPGQPGPGAERAERRRAAGPLADRGGGGRPAVPGHAAPVAGHAGAAHGDRRVHLCQPGRAARGRRPARAGLPAAGVHRGRALGGLLPAAARGDGRAAPRSAGTPTSAGPGLRSTAAAIRRLRAEPWLMGAADYQAGLAAGAAEPLSGPPEPSPWDGRLADLMRNAGRAITEERMLPSLLAELAAAGVGG